jgi:hypothetical protein
MNSETFFFRKISGKISFLSLDFIHCPCAASPVTVNFSGFGVVEGRETGLGAPLSDTSKI